MTREKIQDELAEKFKEFPGVNFNFSQLIRDNVEEALSGVKGANSIKLFGSDLKKLEEYAQQVSADPPRRCRASRTWASFTSSASPI